MLKWLIFVALIVFVYYFFFRRPKAQNKDIKDTKDSIMFPCDKCGTYVSSDECVLKDGKYYCSNECAKLKG